MPQPILIEFVTNLDAVEKAIDSLEQLGIVDKQTAESFRQTSASVREANKDLANTSKQADAVKIDMQELADAINQIPEKIVDDAAQKSLNDAGKNTKDLTEKSIKLTTQLRNIKQEMSALELAGKTNSARYRDLAKQAGTYQDQIGDTSARVKILASDSRNLDAALSLTTGVAGGFSVAQGMAALFGSENEDLMKTMMKVQGALALVNGLQAIAATLNKDSAASVVLLSGVQKAYTAYIGQSTAAMVVFKNVMIGLGIGAVIVGVIALVRYMNSLKEEVSAVDLAMQESNKSIVEQRVQLDSLLTIARDTNNSLEDRKKAVQALNDISPEYLGNLTLETINTDAASAAIRRYLDTIKAKALATALESQLVENYNKKLEATQKLTDAINGKTTLKQQWDALKEGKTVREQAVDEIMEANIEIQNLSESLVKLKVSADIIDEPQKNKIKEVAKSAKEAKPEVDALGAAFEKLGMILGKAYGDALKKNIADVGEWADAASAANDQIAAALMGDDEAEIAAANEKWNALLDLAQKYGIDNTGILAAQAADITEIERLQSEERKKILTAEQEAKIDSWMNYISYVEMGFNAVGDIFKSALDNELTNLENQLKQKQISQTQFDKASAEAREKEAKRTKILSVFQAALDVPKAFLTGLTTPGGGLPLAIFYAALATLQLGLVASAKLPQFAKGTRKVEGGQPGKDSVHALLMPGEGVFTAETNRDYDPILTKIHNREISPGILNAIAEMPSYALMLGGLNMPGIDITTGPEFDYHRFGMEVGKQLEKLPITSYNWDINGVYRSIINGTTRVKFYEDRYSSN